MIETEFSLKPIGVIRSELVSREEAPNQGSEGGLDAWLEVGSAFSEGLEGIGLGDDVILITWFHKAHRSLLKVHPRRDANRPLTGVFATRSPSRPNALGLSVVKLVEITGKTLIIEDLDIVDGTPLLDIKPYLPDFQDQSSIKLGWIEPHKEKFYENIK